jgi:hypothetical protein
MPTKTMDHNKYQKRVRKMSTEQLRYTIQDCQETLKAWPDCENHGYYTDEIHYCSAELRNRQKAPHHIF